MSTEAAVEQGTRFPLDRPGVADLVFLFVAIVALRGAAQGLLDDPGLGWHLRNIDAIRDNGWFLTQDPFTDPRGQEPPRWYTNQWLGELPLYLGWRLAGLEGIAVVCALVIALIARTMFRILVHDGLSWPVAVIWTALGTVGTSCSWVARPNLFTILFVLITARVLDQYHQGKLSRSRTLWLLPLFAAWANIHGGFLAGFILLALAGAVDVTLALCSLEADVRRAARHRVVFLTVLSAAAFLATLLNPYGLSLYPWTFKLLGNKEFMDLHMEWKPPPFNAPDAIRYELLFLLFPLVLAVSRRRPSLLELGLSLGWLHLALTGYRYVALWVVVTVPMLARSSIEIPYLQELARRWQLSAGPGSLFFTLRGAAPWLWTGLFAIALLGAGWAMRGQLAQHQQKMIATKALDRFLEVHADWRKRHGRRPTIYHSYDWGGYLTWHGWPDVLNWIDDRNEVQGKKHIEEHFAIRDTKPGWEKALSGVDLICVESGAALTYRLIERPQVWKERYRDDYALIFERARDPAEGSR
jgi:hypothetical protein